MPSKKERVSATAKNRLDPRADDLVRETLDWLDRYLAARWPVDRRGSTGAERQSARRREIDPFFFG